MMKTLHQQRGGTIVGFIAGVITGLVIAVVIAMVVTKASIPFSQKHTKQGKIAEAATASMAASLDPNKPLYGSASSAKDAVKPSASASAKTSTHTAPETVQKSAVVEPSKSTADDPIAAVIRKKSAESGPAHKLEANADDKWTYLLQTNAYRESAEAQNERARLALSGFEARVSETTINGTRLYRVRLGPFANLDAMNKMRSKLSDNGINAAVVRIPK